ncbi:MAG: HPr family phosphocarrier protein [Bdellovibrionales bacterium]|nr:HPr family phosphocarrier protein [Bdellovibrionales bacterium]
MDTLVNAEQQKGVLVFKSPFSGFIIPLEEVPDPVFAQKMVGDGLAIDPTSEFLLAPFDGEVVQIHPAHHALTLRHGPTGLEALIHIGLDTVQLASEKVRIPISEGIHARPASLILQTAKRFEGEISIHWENRQANCRSLVQILELAIPGDAFVQFHASGPDAKQALEELARVTRELKEVHAPTDKKLHKQARLLASERINSEALSLLQEWPLGRSSWFNMKLSNHTNRAEE